MAFVFYGALHSGGSEWKVRQVFDQKYFRKLVKLLELVKMSVNLCGALTRSLYQVWISRTDASNKLSGNALTFALYDMDIYPSSSQVHEMLQSASECSKRKNPDYITFGEFCIFASELQTSYDNKVPRSIPLSGCSKKELSNRKSRSAKLKAINSANINSSTNKPPKFQVFLGGSCNPTTWRQNIAIPFFKEHGIMSYNPQVARWGPELIQLENQAKQNAEVMFFVIDNQTRSVASMIEASHIGGTDKKLILVMNEIPGPGTEVLGEAITEKEHQELQKGHHYLQDLTERQNIPVFREIQEALNSTERILRENIRPQDLTLMDTSRPVRMAHLLLGEKLGKMRDFFNSLDVKNSGFISLDDVCLAFKMVMSQDLNVNQLKAIIEGQNGKLVTPVNLDTVTISFDQFCCIMSEFATPPRMLKDSNSNTVGPLLSSLAGKVLHVLRSVVYPFSQLVDWFAKPREDSVVSQTDIQFQCEYKDIYLGGSGGSSTWRQNVAIPYLKKQGLTYYSPLESTWNERLVPLEAACIDKCSVLLFVITDDSRALSEMVLAGHYIGQGCNVVLCINLLKEGVVINGETLTQLAVKDYNRGRVYLSDIANRAGVPIFDDVSEALECAAKKCNVDP